MGLGRELCVRSTGIGYGTWARGVCEVNGDWIWDLGERAVLVDVKPGMGKSSTTTQVTWHTKLADPTSWVVRINWNEHTRKLQEIKHSISIRLLNSSVVLHLVNGNLQTLTGICSNRAAEQWKCNSLNGRA